MILVRVGLSSDDDSAYARLFQSLWDGSDDLAIVERDVVPPPGAVAAMLACPEPWCSHPVWLGDHYEERTLSLVKFSRELQRRLPDLGRLAAESNGAGRPPTHWRSLDSAVTRVLDFAGVRVHVHQPAAEHLHKYPGSPPGGPAPATPEPPA